MISQEVGEKEREFGEWGISYVITKKCSESKTLRSAGHVSDSQEKDIKVYSATAMSAFITFIRAYESDQNSKMSGIRSEIEEITDI